MKIYGGGFGSALAVDPRSPRHFYLLTDRGPNTDNNEPDQKVFPVPEFAPQIGRFRLDGDKLVLVETIELRDAKGRKVTGLPNPTHGSTGEVAVDLKGRSPQADTRRIMAAIADLLPPEARRQREPTPEQLARTFPPGHRGDDDSEADRRPGED